MTAEARRGIVARWFGAYLLDGDRILASYPSPTDLAALAARRRLRREGRLTPEEERLLAEAAGQRLASRDRRFEAFGVAVDPTFDEDVPVPEGAGGDLLRGLVLAEGAESLTASWDPSVHVEEAVRTMADLDRAMNLLAERLVSWAARDAPRTPGEVSEDPRHLAESLLGGSTAADSSELPGPDPALTKGRAALARLYLESRATREELERAVAESLPRRAPNISRLLGAELGARLIAQAGGLDRLARLPASTVQVLGAERAFFEHLRGRAPPPRHGLLFLHPTIQGAPRTVRGKLARALAGKVAIAARLDLGGSPVDDRLLASYERRREGVRAERAAKKRGGRAGGAGSAPPLDRTTENR